MTSKSNRTTIVDLDDLTPEKIAGLPVAQLYMLQEDIIEAAAALKRRSARLVAALGVRYAPHDKASRNTHHKPTGIIRLTDGEYEIISDADKTVKWDQPKLDAILDDIPDGWTHYAKYTLSVPEAKFTAAPPSIQIKLEPARTVIAAPAKFKIEKKENGK